MPESRMVETRLSRYDAAMASILRADFRPGPRSRCARTAPITLSAQLARKPEQPGASVFQGHRPQISGFRRLHLLMK